MLNGYVSSKMVVKVEKMAGFWCYNRREFFLKKLTRPKGCFIGLSGIGNRFVWNGHPRLENRCYSPKSNHLNGLMPSGIIH